MKKNIIIHIPILTLFHDGLVNERNLYRLLMMQERHPDRTSLN